MMIISASTESSVVLHFNYSTLEYSQICMTEAPKIEEFLTFRSIQSRYILGNFILLAGRLVLCKVTNQFFI